MLEKASKSIEAVIKSIKESDIEAYEKAAIDHLNEGYNSHNIDNILKLKSAVESVQSSFSSSIIDRIDEEILCLRAIIKLNKIIENGPGDDSESDAVFILENMGHYSAISAMKLMTAMDYPTHVDIPIDDESSTLNRYSKIIRNIFEGLLSASEKDLGKGMVFSGNILISKVIKDIYKIPGTSRNKDVRLLIDFMRKNHGKSDPIMRSFFSKIDHHYSSEKLLIEDIPVFDSGTITNPEIIFSIVKSFPDGDVNVPVLMRENIDAEFVFGSDAVDGEMVIRKNPFVKKIKSGSLKADMFLAFSTSSIKDSYVRSIMDFSITFGVSIPKGYKLCSINAKAAMELCCGSIDRGRIRLTGAIASTVWINQRPEKKEELRHISEVISLSSFNNKVKYNKDFSAGILKNMGTDFAKKLIETILEKHDSSKVSYWSGSVVIDSICSFKSELGVLPDRGSFFIGNSTQIHDLNNAGVRFTDMFYPNGDVLHDFRKVMKIEDLITLSNMGAYLSVKDPPRDINQALELASRRKKKVEYTALLRSYSFDELIKIAKTVNHFSALINAFPEKIDKMINIMPRKNRQMLISDQFEL